VLSVLPDTAILIKYTIACLILFLTPGPDMSLFLAKTVAGGRRAGIASMLGASIGCLVHTVLVAAGLSLLIAASPTGFAILKIVGALYLGWLAWGALRQGSALSIREGGEPVKLSFWKTLLTGIGVNLTNPKVVLFFITFLPLFVAADDPHASGKLMLLGSYFVLISIVLGTVMILLAERLIATLKRNPKVMRAIDYLFAGVFGAFAMSILTAQARN